MITAGLYILYHSLKIAADFFFFFLQEPVPCLGHDCIVYSSIANLHIVSSLLKRGCYGVAAAGYPLYARPRLAT